MAEPQTTPAWNSPLHHELLNERQKLLDKLFAHTLSAAEAYRLVVVRAMLDAIDMSRRQPA